MHRNGDVMYLKTKPDLQYESVYHNSGDSSSVVQTDQSLINRKHGLREKGNNI